MKRVCLAVLLACGSLWCGHAYGYGYLPEVDSITGLCTFKKEVQISELTDKEAYAGSIGPTDEKGSTPISFSWQNPATKANESVCWSAKVWRNLSASSPTSSLVPCLTVSMCSV